MRQPENHDMRPRGTKPDRAFGRDTDAAGPDHPAVLKIMQLDDGTGDVRSRGEEGVITAPRVYDPHKHRTRPHDDRGHNRFLPLYRDFRDPLASGDGPCAGREQNDKKEPSKRILTPVSQKIPRGENTILRQNWQEK